MAEQPAITVIIPAYNAAHTLARAVESVWSTGYRAASVLIVDDGSGDGTLTLARQICAAQSDRCRVLQHADRARQGVSASRNLGLECADTEWVSFLDADDEYLPNRFTGFIAALESGAPFDGLYELAEVRSEAATPEPLWWNADGDARFGIAERLDSQGLLRRLLEGGGWSTAAIVVRRALVRAVGSFDPAKRIAEDCDLWFRLAAAGKIVGGALDRPVTIYWRHGDNSFQQRPEHRVAMLSAMLDAWRWSQSNANGRTRLQAFDEMVPRYALRGMMAMREAGRPEIALQLWRLMLRRGRFAVLFDPAASRQALAALGERLGLRTGPGRAAT